jgi:hypothetical protein
MATCYITMFLYMAITYHLSPITYHSLCQLLLYRYSMFTRTKQRQLPFLICQRCISTVKCNPFFGPSLNSFTYQVLMTDSSCSQLYQFVCRPPHNGSHSHHRLHPHHMHCWKKRNRRTTFMLFKPLLSLSHEKAAMTLTSFFFD